MDGDRSTESSGSSSLDTGEERSQTDIVKLKFSIYVCEGGLAWHFGGDLSYRVRCGLSCPFSFFLSEKWPVFLFHFFFFSNK